MILSSTTPPTVFSAPPRPLVMDVPPTMTIGMTSIGPQRQVAGETAAHHDDADGREQALEDICAPDSALWPLRSATEMLSAHEEQIMAELRIAQKQLCQHRQQQWC